MRRAAAEPPLTARPGLAWPGPRCVFSPSGLLLCVHRIYRCTGLGLAEARRGGAKDASAMLWHSHARTRPHAFTHTGHGRCRHVLRIHIRMANIMLAGTLSACMASTRAVPFTRTQASKRY